MFCLVLFCFGLVGFDSVGFSARWVLGVGRLPVGVGGKA
jgi:hypothetical protein